MRKTHPVYKSKNVTHSLNRYSLRLRKDTCLHDDVEAFLTKHDASLDCVVDMLLDNRFPQKRNTDPSYPV